MKCKKKKVEKNEKAFKKDNFKFKLTIFLKLKIHIKYIFEIYTC